MQFIYGWCAGSSIDSAAYLHRWSTASSIHSAVYLWLIYREFYTQRIYLWLFYFEFYKQRSLTYCWAIASTADSAVYLWLIYSQFYRHHSSTANSHRHESTELGGTYESSACVSTCKNTHCRNKHNKPRKTKLPTTADKRRRLCRPDDQ